MKAQLPRMNATAEPMTPKLEPIAVAVTLSCGGNQVADSVGMAAIPIGPATPFRNWPKCISL